MGGSCHLPLGAFATINEQTSLDLKAVVGDPEDGQLVFSHATGSLDGGRELACEVVEDLLRQGADEILQRVNAIE
jgi:porphobilinogen deaminase